jgi:hypothetical protein
MTLNNDNVLMSDVDPHDAFRLGAHRIRLDFSYFETTLAPNVPSALFEILTAWNQNVPDATFVDHDGVVIDLDDWPDEKTFKYRFSMSIIEARKRHIAVGFSFRTKSTFTQIKAISRPLLQKYSAWLYPHPLEFTQLDIVPLGFLTHTNPRFHSSARVSSDVQELILRNYDDLASNVRDNFLDEHYDHFDDEGELEMPPIMIAPANVNSGDERTQAYEIQVERKNVGATKILLEAIYSLTATEPTDQRFIPYSLKHESQDIYRSILRTQNEYLENHRNIPLAGITAAQMHFTIQWDGKEQTPHSILSTLPGVSRVDSTTRTHDLGKYNMSTTAATYLTNTNWIDSKITAIFALCDPDSSLDQGPFPQPVRMSRRPARRQSTKPRPKTSAYTEHLRTQYPTTVGTPTPPTRNAWQNRSRTQPTFNYTVGEFPSLTPSPNFTTPINSQPTQLPTQLPPPSQSTPSTMTEADTRKFIAECVSQEHAKFTTVNSKIATDMASIRQDFKQMLDQNRATQNLQMHKYIKESIAETAKSLTESTTTPYATTAQMNQLFDGFKAEIKLMLAHPPVPPIHPLSPMGSPYAYGMYPSLNYPMQNMQNIQHHPGGHSPPTLTVTPAYKRTREGTPENATQHGNGVFFDASMIDANSTDSNQDQRLPPPGSHESSDPLSAPLSQQGSASE